MKKLVICIVTLFALASCGKPVDIINPDATFLYFYGATCPHCQELNSYLDSNDLYPKLSLEKREVYYNADNNAMFLALAKQLGIAQSDLGVPFVYNKETGKYTVGVQPAIEQFEGSLSSPETEEAIIDTPAQNVEDVNIDAENMTSTPSE